MAYWHIPNWIKKIITSVTWDIDQFGKKNKNIYLTFDDGPTPNVTDKVLDTLSEFDAKASFFCIGRNVERYPDIYKRIVEKGHAIGNHTYSHLKGWKANNEEYVKDIELADNIIKSTMFRPPYGQIRKSQINLVRKKYQIILWDVMSHDYNPKKSHELILKRIKRHTKPGSIVVFHDSYKAWGNLKKILPDYLAYFKEQGYSFQRL